MQTKISFGLVKNILDRACPMFDYEFFSLYVCHISHNRRKCWHKSMPVSTVRIRSRLQVLVLILLLFYMVFL